MNEKTEFARNLRKQLTPQEWILWQLLRNHSFYSYEFRRQYVIGEYIVDFVCRKKKIIIEIDGGQHNTPEEIIYDKKRTEFLNSRGYKVIRFWNGDIDKNIDGVYKVVLREFGVCRDWICFPYGIAPTLPSLSLAWHLSHSMDVVGENKVLEKSIPPPIKGGDAP